MECLTLLLFFFVLAMLRFFITNFGLQSSKVGNGKLPPGPPPFPIIGNILELGTHPHRTLTNLSKTYGPIMTLKLGSITTIVISSPEVAKETLHKNDLAFSCRKISDSVRACDHDKHSMVFLPISSKWRILRRAVATKVFSPQQLDSTQTLRQRKVQELLDFVHACSKKGEALEIGEAIFTTVLNIMSNTLFSVDLGCYTSDKSQEFKNIMWGMMEEAGKPNIVDLFPSLCLLDPQGARARMTTYSQKLIKFFDGVIEERLRSRASKMESMVFNDVADSLVDLMMEDNSEVSRDDLLHLFMDLFVAGVDTTSSTVEWAMAELLCNPEKLRKVRKELESIFLEKDQQLEESLISSKLPYLQAVVKETFRLHPPTPLLVPRQSNDDVELHGFMVPKDAQILVNVWAIGRDSSIWSNPNQFMPERFLESGIDFKGHNFELIPFGAGRRICPGLTLASRTISFILASLLRFYDWKLPYGQKPEDMDLTDKFGLTLHKNQPLRAIPIK